MIPWQQIFSEMKWSSQPDGTIAVATLPALRQFLDAIHIRHCLVRPYQELQDYPLVEARELLPSFDVDLYEYAKLPGFALVAFGRRLDYFSEIFQYDKLHAVEVDATGAACPLEHAVLERNLQIVSERLPRCHQQNLRNIVQGLDLTLLENYGTILPWLLEMDRAHVFGLDADNFFHLAGVFASFPSDMDSEIKRFGIRIGKFTPGDNSSYERNRMFVYQYLMELYGFPIVSERRTSSALFARKLHRMGENFLLRVMGQSDRTITTYFSDSEPRRYPRVDKIALVTVDEDQKDAIEIITRKGFFLDPVRRVVIMRVVYRQHRYDAANVRQDRALSVLNQEILHPLTGNPLRGLNIIKDASNMFLRLNDIVRGEYMGRIVYKRTEVVENTDTDEKRLKFLYSWLTKHQRRMVSYTDDFFDNISKVISSYLKSPQKVEAFDSLRSLYQEVCGRLSYIQQARRVRILEDLARRNMRGERIGYRQMSHETVRLLTDLQFEIVNFFPDLVHSIITCTNNILHDSYLQRAYITPPESTLTKSGLEIRKNYGRIVALLDAIKSVRKARLKSSLDKTEERGPNSILAKPDKAKAGADQFEITKLQQGKTTSVAPNKASSMLPAVLKQVPVENHGQNADIAKPDNKETTTA